MQSVQKAQAALRAMTPTGKHHHAGGGGFGASVARRRGGGDVADDHGDATPHDAHDRSHGAGGPLSAVGPMARHGRRWWRGA